MKLSRLFLSLAGLAILFICVTPGWGDRIPSKKPSDYGDPKSDVALLAPTSVTSMDDVTVTLNSVFCNGCEPNITGGITYFYEVTLNSPTAALMSLTFGPGFNTTDPSAFAFVQFDPASSAGDSCLSSTGTYLCGVPFSSTSLNLSTVTSTLTCAADGSCTLDFTNFNFATLGGGPIVLAASAPFGDAGLLDSNGNPTAPSVTINRSVSTVPEPHEFWFVGIALAGLGLIVGRQRTTLFSE